MYLSSIPDSDVVDLSLNHPLSQGAGESLGRSLAEMIAEADLEELSLYHPPHGRKPTIGPRASIGLPSSGVEGRGRGHHGGRRWTGGAARFLLAFVRHGDVVLTE